MPWSNINDRLPHGLKSTVNRTAPQGLEEEIRFNCPRPLFRYLNTLHPHSAWLCIGAVPNGLRDPSFGRAEWQDTAD